MGRQPGGLPVDLEESARVDGAEDFLVLPATHTFIMNRTDVADATIRFLETGRFGDE